MARKEIFENSYIYHIFNRGVDKRKIFLDQKDYKRFCDNLYTFNDKKPVLSDYRHRLAKTNDVTDFGNRQDEREKLVEILAFCLMPNHFHLLVRQLVDNGVTTFMRKNGVGFANYFNKKYDRSGTLFQGRFRAVLVEKDNQLSYLPYYIHFNPLNLVIPGWREKKIIDRKKALNFLYNYQWSSLPSYMGKDNLSFLLDKKFLVNLIGAPEEVKRNTKNDLRRENSTVGPR